MQTFGGLEHEYTLFSSSQAKEFRGAKEIELVNRIANNKLSSFISKNHTIAFFSKSEIQRRLEINNFNKILGFKDDIRETLLSYSNEKNLIKEFELAIKNSKELIHLSLDKIPMICWGGVKLTFSEQIFGDKIDTHVIRNFRWELRLLGSKDVLGFAQWNDLTGIKELVKRLEDTKALDITQGLLNSEFFKQNSSLSKSS